MFTGRKERSIRPIRSWHRIPPPGHHAAWSGYLRCFQRCESSLFLLHNRLGLLDSLCQFWEVAFLGQLALELPHLHQRRVESLLPLGHLTLELGELPLNLSILHLESPLDLNICILLPILLRKIR